MYSVVEGKSIKEINPRIRDKVRVKDSAGTWEGIVQVAGSESQCKDKQIQLEQICENISDKDEESADEDDSMAIVTMTKKGKSSSGAVEKRKRVKQLISEDKNEQEESYGIGCENGERKG